MNIIFDFNGTMVFDSELHKRAWKKFLSERCQKQIDEEDMRKYVIGRHTSEIVERFLGKIDEEQLDLLAREKERVYRELCMELGEAYTLVPGLEHYLDHLKECRANMTIATGSIKENVLFFIERFKLDKWFDISKIIYDDGTLPGKPDPSIYFKAAEAIHAKPEDCEVFEDSLSGIRAARLFGAKKITAITADITYEEFRKNTDVDRIIDDYYALL